MLDFTPFKNAVANQFQLMQPLGLFRTSATKVLMWNTYLNSFPPGTNPIYRVRTQHDGTYDKQFIRTLGNVVTILPSGKVCSIWDITVNEPAYQTVANEMARVVKAFEIENIFCHYESKIGVDSNFDKDGHMFEHFFVRLSEDYVLKKSKIGPKLSETRSNFDVFLRSLDELTVDSVETVLELISQKSLYRGEEFASTLKEFLKTKKTYMNLESNRREYTWQQLNLVSPLVSRIRNSSIGTLLIDLSEGMDLEEAVRRYESVMAPSNYKRPTALVTKAMVEKAKDAVNQLGLSLERRYAKLSDVSINNVLFVDHNITLKDSVFDDIATKVVVPNLDRVDTVTIEQFVSDIIPHVTSMEIMLDNKHLGNLMSLVAPVDQDAKNLFKWNNNFSWTYNGDVADSIKERVKKAGGNVVGDLCCRLAWFNYDDLDLYMCEPDGFKIYYRNKRSLNTGGQLDVDMNAGTCTTREPVENIFYTNKHQMLKGAYRLSVNQFHKREREDPGFECEIDIQGTVHTLVYDKPVPEDKTILVAELFYDGNDIKIIPSLPSTQASKNVWGLKTMEFHKVNLMTLSPNYWNGGVGNKHYFFFIKDCKNDGTARGFYNEFLKEELSEHRKVIEIVGSKMRAEESEHQLSGLGFSSTKRDELLIRVKGSYTRVLKVLI